MKITQTLFQHFPYPFLTHDFVKYKIRLLHKTQDKKKFTTILKNQMVFYKSNWFDARIATSERVEYQTRNGLFRNGIRKQATGPRVVSRRRGTRRKVMLPLQLNIFPNPERRHVNIIYLFIICKVMFLQKLKSKNLF